MRVKIEIPDDVIPGGYSPVGYRQATKDEPYLNDSASLVEAGPTAHHCLVLRKNPEWPVGITCRAIAKDRSGSVTAFCHGVPVFDSEKGAWGRNLYRYTISEIYDCSFLDGIEPEHSLMVNPNFKLDQTMETNHE